MYNLLCIEDSGFWTGPKSVANPVFLNEYRPVDYRKRSNGHYYYRVEELQGWYHENGFIRTSEKDEAERKINFELKIVKR